MTDAERLAELAPPCGVESCPLPADAVVETGPAVGGRENTVGYTCRFHLDRVAVAFSRLNRGDVHVRKWER